MAYTVAVLLANKLRHLAAARDGQAAASPSTPCRALALVCTHCNIHTHTPLHCSITQPLPAEQQSALQLLPNFRVLDDNGGGQVGIVAVLSGGGGRRLTPMTPMTPWRMNEEAG